MLRSLCSQCLEKYVVDGAVQLLDPVVTRESRRNSRKTTWFTHHLKMKPFPATATQEKSHVRYWRSKRYLAPLPCGRPGFDP